MISPLRPLGRETKEVASMNTNYSTAKLSLEELESRDVPSAGVGTFAAASLILHSTESYADLVTSEYQQFLGRAPDTNGFVFFVNQLQNGVAPQVIDAEFLSSAEFIGEHGGVTGGWVPALYSKLLGRAPTTAEATFWIDEALMGMTPSQIALDVATSVERDADVVKSEFMTLLGHSPNTADLDFFVSAMQQGATRLAVEATIMGSVEFFTDHGNTNTGFVDAVFAEALGRQPSTAELNFWLGEISVLA
jgi:hypothetical protein